jgi:hypothetical protein
VRPCRILRKRGPQRRYQLYYGDPVNWAAITAIGTVLAGLALPLAFIQLGALRQDRLRAQVSKVGAWAQKPTLLDKRATFWFIPVFVRNSSELPVQIDAVDAAIRPWGYERTLAAPEGATEVEYYADKRFGAISEAHFAPGTIAPGGTWDVGYTYDAEVVFDSPEPPMVSVTRVVITDAAGH